MTTTVGYEYLTIERKGYIATITLNRPDRMNALNKELTREFHEVLDEVDLEFPDIRVVIITGAGRGFCAGADVLGQAQTLQQNEEKPASPPAPSASVGWIFSLLASSVGWMAGVSLLLLYLYDVLYMLLMVQKKFVPQDTVFVPLITYRDCCK